MKSKFVALLLVLTLLAAVPVAPALALTAPDTGWEAAVTTIVNQALSGGTYTVDDVSKHLESYIETHAALPSDENPERGFALFAAARNQASPASAGLSAGTLAASPRAAMNVTVFVHLQGPKVVVIVKISGLVDIEVAVDTAPSIAFVPPADWECPCIATGETGKCIYHLLHPASGDECECGCDCCEDGSCIPDAPVGHLAGQVISAMPNGTDGAPVQGAQIVLSTGTRVVASAFSNASGQYTLSNIPAGTYSLQISAPGFISEELTVEIEPNITVNIHRLRAIPSTGAGNGTVSGSVTSAFTGQKITDSINLQFRRGIDVDGDVVETVTTTNGTYSVSLPAGHYTVTATGAGYIDTVEYVYSYGGAVLSNQNIVISPTLSTGGEGALRIVLSWGQYPYDLDSHLVGPSPSGEDFHVYYYDEEHTVNSVLYANLDVDDTTSYGPETVTIYQPVNGTYNYYIQDYSNRNSTTSTALRDSQAVVRIYSANNELLRTFNVPTSGGPSSIWHVFSLEMRNGRYTIVPANSMINTPTSSHLVGSRASTMSLFETDMDWTDDKASSEIPEELEVPEELVEELAEELELSPAA